MAEPLTWTEIQRGLWGFACGGSLEDWDRGRGMHHCLRPGTFGKAWFPRTIPLCLEDTTSGECRAYSKVNVLFNAWTKGQRVEDDGAGGVAAA